MKKMILLAALAAAPAVAATPESYRALEARVAAACGKASGFERAKVSPTTVRFSDEAGVDARLVTGIYPQPHMKRAQGLMLCLYERRSGRVEVQDAESWWARRKG
jgi:hypothetical protein